MGAQFLQGEQVHTTSLSRSTKPSAMQDVSDRSTQESTQQCGVRAQTEAFGAASSLPRPMDGWFVALSYPERAFPATSGVTVCKSTTV
jgi:hypothetical protein